MNGIKRFLWERLTKAGRRERAGRHLDDLMAEGEPGWGWSKTNSFKLFDYVCTCGAVKVPLSKVPIKVIYKAIKRYRLSAIFEGDHVWVGADSRLLIRKMRESRRSQQAI